MKQEPLKKKPMGEADVEITMELLRSIKPQQIYCAGDLAGSSRHAQSLPGYCL